MTRLRRTLIGKPTRREIALTLGALAAGQIEVWGFWVEREQGSRALAACAISVMALPLLAWARAPLVALAGVCLTYAAWLIAAAPAGPLVPFLLVLIAVFGVAARAPFRSALAGGLAGLAVVSLDVATGVPDAVNFLFVGAFVVASWAAGRAAHGRQRRADDFEARAVLAERERDERARAAVAEERARIARELHDSVAHSVGVMVIQAQAARHVEGVPDAAARGLSEIETRGRQALEELRRLLGLLRRGDEEAALAPQPSLRRLDALVDGVRGAGLPVAVRVLGDPVTLPPGVDSSAYRIVQEGLTNALKHAGPARALVVLDYAGDELGIEVSDDGRSGSGERDGGHGLTGIRERVSVYGGTIAAGPRAGGGYALRVRLPIEQART